MEKSGIQLEKLTTSGIKPLGRGIGNLKDLVYPEPNTKPVELYYPKTVHRELQAEVSGGQTLFRVTNTLALKFSSARSWLVEFRVLNSIPNAVDGFYCSQSKCFTAQTFNELLRMKFVTSIGLDSTYRLQISLPSNQEKLRFPRVYGEEKYLSFHNSPFLELLETIVPYKPPNVTVCADCLLGASVTNASLKTTNMLGGSFSDAGSHSQQQTGKNPHVPAFFHSQLQPATLYSDPETEIISQIQPAAIEYAKVQTLAEYEFGYEYADGYLVV